jgi:hypothetical protein
MFSLQQNSRNIQQIMAASTMPLGLRPGGKGSVTLRFTILA